MVILIVPCCCLSVCLSVCLFVCRFTGATKTDDRITLNIDNIVVVAAAANVDVSQRQIVDSFGAHARVIVVAIDVSLLII